MPLPHLNLRSLPRHRLLLAAKIALVLIVIYALLGFFALPALLKNWVAPRLGEQIGRRVEIGEAHFNPFTLEATLQRLALYEADRQTAALTVGELYANVSSFSLLRLAPVLSEVRVEQPVVHIVRSGETRFNFSDIIDRMRAKPADDGGEAHFSVSNIHLRQGRIDYDDQWRQSQHSLSDIDLALPFLSNLGRRADVFTTPAFSAKLDGSPFEISGKTRPFATTHDAALQIDLDGLSLPQFMALVPIPLNFQLESGLLDTRLTVNFHQDDSGNSIVVSGHSALREVKLQDRDGAPLLQWEALSVELERLEPFQKQVQFSAIKLQGPQVQAVRLADGTLNLQRAFTLPPPESDGDAATAPEPDKEADKKTDKEPAAKPAQPFALGIAHAEVSGGRLQWRDAATGAGEAALDIAKLDAALDHFSSTGDSAAQVQFSAETDAAETLSYQGELAADGKSLQGELQVGALKPQRLQPYFATLFAGSLGDTQINATLPHRLAWGEESPQLTLEQGSVALQPLQVLLPGAKQPALGARDITLSGLQFDLAQHRAGAEQLLLDGVAVALQRRSDGNIDLLTALQPAKTPAAPEKKNRHAAPQKTGETAPPEGWQLDLQHLKLAQSELRFADALVAPQNKGKPALQQFKKIDLAVDDIALRLDGGGIHAQPLPVALQLTHNQSGHLALKGKLSLQPLGADLQIDARGLGLPAFQPYIADHSNASISRGALNAKGKLTFELADQHPLRASYAGNLSLTGVRTLDRVSGDDFARWKTFSISTIKARIDGDQPLRLALGDITLADFYARVIVNSNGRLNLQDIVATPGDGETAPTRSLTQAAPAEAKPAETPAPAPAKEEEASGPKPDIRIERIKLQGGNINFTDNFVQPNYSANLTGMAGSVSQLASDAKEPADVALQGKLDGDAPVDINGKVDPLGAELFLDLTASAHGIELTRLTPYAAKYAGYAITKGKLSADVKYHIEKGKLEAQNNLFVDQLTFGDKVDSPDATKLPVLLAVALLRNSRGEIDLHLPVSGSLSDPEFSVGGIIVRALINLLTKAVTAPFSLLASAFQGADDVGELSYVEFDPGAGTLSDKADKKLDALAKALADRPELKLEITGRIDPATDRDGVRHLWLQRQLQRQKIEDLRDQGSAVQLREVSVKPDEYEKYLKQVYKAAKFDKPRNMIGLTKSLPVPEMEKLLLEHAPVDESALKELAEQRASNVKRYLEERGKIADQRLFLIAPKLSAEGIEGGGAPNRVEFSISR